jgi:hypothetical protein
MNYLRIASPGIADYRALTIIGVGTSRYSDNSSMIGQFASGSKMAAALLLRKNLPPVIITGNLRLYYSTTPIVVGGYDFEQVTVRYSGTDINGSSKTSTEDLGYTVEAGELDWDDVTMGPREYVANAIDACYLQNLDPADHVEIDIVQNIRAKKGWTQVYIPADHDDIIRFYRELHIRFLHFQRRHLLDRKMLPKIVPSEPEVVRIYKKGVLVGTLDEMSVYDYNLGDELRLDESRNAQSWDTKYAIAKALANAEAERIAPVIKALVERPKGLLEADLSPESLGDRYRSDTLPARQEQWQKAFRMVAGEDGVASTGLAGVNSHLEAKGYRPVVLPAPWVRVLKEMEARTEDKVLTESEKAGETISEPTEDMIRAVDQVWELLEVNGMTNGKEKPPVKAFTTVMTAGCQVLGRYRDGTVFLHTDIGGMSPMLLQTALEEVIHHCSGSLDCSRDIQDYLFRLVVKMAF